LKLAKALRSLVAVAGLALHEAGKALDDFGKNVANPALAGIGRDFEWDDKSMVGGTLEVA
jgi:hypothetical protein